MTITSLAWLSSLASASPTLSAGYTGHSLVHPGIHARGELPLRGPLRLGVELGAYLHPQNQLALWVTPRLALRVEGGERGLFELGLAAGALRATWLAPTVSVQSGALEPQPLAGAGYLTGRLDLAGGRQLDRAGLNHWLLGPSLGLRAPHANGVGLDLYLRLDLGFGGPS